MTKQLTTVHLDLVPQESDRLAVLCGPFDDNIFDWSEEQQSTLASIPTSLEEALGALREDHDYLMAGGVFNRELINSWIEEKMKEVIAVRNRPHPFEMNLYYSL